MWLDWIFTMRIWKEVLVFADLRKAPGRLLKESQHAHHMLSSELRSQTTADEWFSTCQESFPHSTYFQGKRASPTFDKAAFTVTKSQADKSQVDWSVEVLLGMIHGWESANDTLLFHHENFQLYRHPTVWWLFFRRESSSSVLYVSSGCSVLHATKFVRENCSQSSTHLVSASIKEDLWGPQIL